MERALPASAGVDVVEVGRAVCVGLGPFAAERGAESGGEMGVSFLRGFVNVVGGKEGKFAFGRVLSRL